MIQQEHHLRINLQLLGLFHEDASLPKSSPLGNLHSKKTFPIFNTKYIFKRSIFLLPSTKRYCRFGTLSAKKLHQSKHTTTKNNIVLFFVKILNDELFFIKVVETDPKQGESTAFRWNLALLATGHGGGSRVDGGRPVSSWSFFSGFVGDGLTMIFSKLFK